MTEIKEFGEKVLVKRADCPASRPPLYLSPFAPLVQASATRGRQRCPSCNGSRLYFCYDCRRFMSGIEPFSPKVEVLLWAGFFVVN
jgi:hypothetical protein